MSSRFTAPTQLSYRERAQAASSSSNPASGRSSPYLPNGYASGSGMSTPFGGNDTAASGSHSRSSWQTSRSAEELESQNDERIEGLSAKVSLLKNITIGIGNEVRESTIQLTQMNDAFSETSGILAGTFTRLNNMAARQGGRWALYMIFLVFVFWFFVVVWWFRR